MKFNQGDILVPPGMNYPERAVVVPGLAKDGYVLAHPVGGGLEMAFLPSMLAGYRVVSEEEQRGGEIGAVQRLAQQLQCFQD